MMFICRHIPNDTIYTILYNTCLITVATYINFENILDIKSRSKAGNSCHYSVQTLLSSRLLSKDLKIKIYKTIILPVVLYGCEAWSLTLREEHRLRVFKNRILKRILLTRK